MSDLIIQSSSQLIPLPVVPIAVRPATLADLPFIDSLQKMHTKQVGWMPTKQLEGKIAAGHVIVAEEGLTADSTDSTDKTMHSSALSALSVLSAVKSPLGYCIGHDQYFKRDDVGIIYQMNVLPGRQRGLIGATLLKAMFERSAYGCKLFCCWCAQDIAANHFWEAMGFVPLAFRTGGRKGHAARGKGRAADGISSLAPDPSHLVPSARVHIFWQKRIRQGDTSTPWWFPSKTDAGAIREDRIVLPIPPEVRWNDPMPRVLPERRQEGTEAFRHGGVERGNPKQIQSTKSKGPKPKPAGPAPRRVLGGWSFAPPAPAAPVAPVAIPRKPRERMKNDPKLVAAARELRDRWLEEVNAGRYLPASQGKYEVGRSLAGPVRAAAGLLNAA